MKTPVNILKLVGILLCSLLITASSNRSNEIGFWQVLNAKANPFESFWLFPRYFSTHLKQLPQSTLALLARNKIPLAQYEYSLTLLGKGQSETAKLFWLPSLGSLTSQQKIELAEQLLEQSRWGDLKLLGNNNRLPRSDVLSHLNLEVGRSYRVIPKLFLQRLGFLSVNPNVDPDPQCRFNVLMMSDHRSGLYKLAELVNIFDKQPEPAKNVFCFSKPMYVAGAIDCNNEATKMAQCNWPSSLLKKHLPDNFDFIIMMPKYGSANVRNEIMHLSSQANYAVFLHELMHFSGFEDEYVLPLSKQAWLCKKSGLVAPNLFISHGEMPPRGWHKSQSCQYYGVAYKPSEKWSIMQYQQLGLSAQYRTLWLKHLDMTNGHISRYFDTLTPANKAILN